MTIRSLVERERRHLRRAEMAAGSLLAAGASALLLAAAAALLGRARWLTLPRPLPVIAWLVVAAAICALWLRTRRRLRRRASRLDVALAIETEQGMRRGLLVGVIELEGQGPLAERAAASARATLPVDRPLAPALRRDSSRRTILGAGAAAAGLLVLITASPLFADGLRAIFRPIDAWRGTLLSKPRIEGAPQELLRNSPLRLHVLAPGRRVVYLSVRQTGDAWHTDTLRVDSDGRAAWAVGALRGDMHMIATDGRTTSDSVIVRAVDRPFVGALSLRATYPAYLGRAAESQPVGEALRLPRGTVLEVSGRASVALTAIALVGSGSERIALAATGQLFAGRFVIDRALQLRWQATGPNGLVPDLPEPLQLDVIADSVPRVSIIAPLGDTIIASGEPVVLALQASDDHGIASVVLRVARQAGALAFQSLASEVGASWTGAAMIAVDGLLLHEGSWVRVRAEAVDGSPWGQRGVSREIVIRRATSEELRSAARAMGDSAVRAAVAAVSAERSLAQRTEEAARATARQTSARNAPSSNTQSGSQQKSSLTFEGAEKARNIAQEQRAMGDRVEKLRQATQQLEQQLKAAGALDSSLARQLADAQALLRQALTPELQAQMQKLETAAQQMNGEQSRDALRDLAQMQQRMREQLERSAEMLKRAAHEGSMQTLGDEARELAAKERALADSIRRGDRDRGAPSARDAAKLADRAERLKNEMEKLQQRLDKDRAEAGASRTEQAGDYAEKSESEMRRAASEMRDDERAGQSDPQQGGQPKGGDDSGAKRAEDAAAEMDRAASSMQEARSEQVKEWKKELTSELDQAVQEMMQLAREERALEQKTRSSAAGDERRGAQSAVEQGVKKASERLQGAGKKSALLSSRSQRAVAEAKGKVEQATQSVSQPNGSTAQQANALGEAADALTKAAASLARDRERVNSAKSASGFSEMLEQMHQAAQKQGQINGQAQSLMNMPNGSSSAAGQSLARALARQQRQLADQLEEAGDAAGGERAAQLAQEAKQLAEALDNGRLDGGTLARQQQLFRRLLDAGRSLEKEERDDTGKREAKSATGNESFAPGAKVDARAAVKFKPPTWQELRALSVEERRAILDYFTRLNNAQSP